MSQVVAGEFPSTGWVVTAPITSGSFAGSTVQLQLALNTPVQGALNACNAGSLAGVSFTGTQNVSLIKVL